MANNHEDCHSKLLIYIDLGENGVCYSPVNILYLYKLNERGNDSFI